MIPNPLLGTTVILGTVHMNMYIVGFGFCFFKDFIYLFMRDRERETEGGGAETQAEGEVGSMQEAPPGTRSPFSRIRPWTEGGAKPLSYPGLPLISCFE